MKIKIKVTLWFTILMSALAVLFTSIIIVETQKSLVEEAKQKLTFFMEEGVKEAFYLQENPSSNNKYQLEKSDSNWGRSYGMTMVQAATLTTPTIAFADYFESQAEANYEGYNYDETTSEKMLQKMLFIYEAYSTNKADGSYRQPVEVTINKNVYYAMADTYTLIVGEPKVFVGAMIRVDNYRKTLAPMLNAMLWITPMYIVFASLIGYFVVSKAFRPINKIVAKANDIESTQDLSTRIMLPKNKDEIYELVSTLNAMLDRVEMMFLSQQKFTLDASHELRTPIASLMAQCEYAIQETKEEEERQRYMQLHAQANQINRLIQQLLQISRSESGQIKINKEPFDLNELIQMVIAQEIDLHPNADAIVYTPKSIVLDADRDLLMRALFNLLDNAFVYTSDDKKICIETNETREAVIINVIDNGIGIEEKELSNIWNRFYQVDSSRSGNHFGLGLSFVKWIVEAHGGSVEVSSRKGEGSTFTLKFLKMVKR